MALSAEERDWLDGKFGEIHSRITVSQKEQVADTNELRLHVIQIVARMENRFDSHIAAPCKDFVEHEKQKHNPARFWGMIGIIVGIAASAAAVVQVVAGLLK